jgi:hypothetical protein
MSESGLFSSLQRFKSGAESVSAGVAKAKLDPSYDAKMAATTVQLAELSVKKVLDVVASGNPALNDAIAKKVGEMVAGDSMATKPLHTPSGNLSPTQRIK